MGDETTLLGVFISWFPMLLLIGVWVYFMMRMGTFRKGAMTQGQYLEEILSETKRHNAVLEQLLARMEQRVGRFEKGSGPAQ